MSSRGRIAIGPVMIIAATILVGNVVRGGFGTVQEAAKLEMGLTDTALGLVQGLALSIPSALLAVPFGRAVDRSNRVVLMWVMGVLWSLGAVLTAVAHSFPLLFCARMAAGLGTTCGIPAAISLIADFCSPARRGRAILVLGVGQWGGVASAFALGGLLYGWFGRHGGLWGLSPWRSVNLAMGIVSAAWLLSLLAIREPTRHEQGAGVQAPIGVIARELWTWRRFLIPLFVGLAGTVMADSAASIWVAPVLNRTFHLQPDQFGFWVGATLFVSGVCGSVIGGIAADLGQRSRRRGGILVAAVVAATVAVPASLFPIMGSTSTLAVALGLLLTAGPVMGTVTTTAVTVLLPNELRGLCMGVFLAIAGVAGYGIAPTLVTWIAGLLGGDAELGPALAVVGFGVGLMSLGGFLLAMCNVPSRTCDLPSGLRSPHVLK